MTQELAEIVKPSNNNSREISAYDDEIQIDPQMLQTFCEKIKHKML